MSETWHTERKSDLRAEISWCFGSVRRSGAMSSGTAFNFLRSSNPVLWVFNLVPRVRFPFGQDQEHGFWPDAKQEVHESRISDSSTQTQKFETMVVVNGH